MVDTEDLRPSAARRAGSSPVTGTMQDKKFPMWRCPDGGTCHHDCTVNCFRVLCCAPLSGEFPQDKWPDKVVQAHHGLCGAVAEDYGWNGMSGQICTLPAHHPEKDHYFERPKQI